MAALKGKAEALISQAADYLEQNIDPNVVDNCREAVAALTSAAALRPEVTCLWRLMGDALTLMRPLPEEVIAPFEVPGRLAGRSNDQSHAVVALESKLSVLELGARCHARAAQLQPDNAGIWRNLAVNYHAQAQCGGDTDSVAKLRAKALSAAKRALSLEPKSAAHWNVLGVLAMSAGEEYFGVAQHSFIREAIVCCREFSSCDVRFCISLTKLLMYGPLRGLEELCVSTCRIGPVCGFTQPFQTLRYNT